MIDPIRSRIFTHASGSTLDRRAFQPTDEHRKACTPLRLHCRSCLARDPRQLVLGPRERTRTR
eukprot:31520-Pelagococcus_subviridis.AAC.3